ncbi:hypothetical protein H8959_017971 [Pygathrix nigripes]
MALKMVKGSIDRMFDKNLQDLVRGIRNHKEDEFEVPPWAPALPGLGLGRRPRLRSLSLSLTPRGEGLGAAHLGSPLHRITAGKRCSKCNALSPADACSPSGHSVYSLRGRFGPASPLARVTLLRDLRGP